MRNQDNFDERDTIDEEIKSKEMGIESYSNGSAENDEERGNEFSGFESDGFSSYEDKKSNYNGAASGQYYEEIFDRSRPKTMAWSIASMVLGIISVICCCLGWSGLVLGALAVGLAIVSRVTLGYFDGMTIAGLILGIFGVVFGAVMIWAMFGPVAESFNEFFETIPSEFPEDGLPSTGSEL